MSMSRPTPTDRLLLGDARARNAAKLRDETRALVAEIRRHRPDLSDVGLRRLAFRALSNCIDRETSDSARVETYWSTVRRVFDELFPETAGGAP
jgi:hypothetical protein